MLKHLHIQNYALIKHLDIDFQTGFTVLTGETGAGKSIIIGALNLVMGARADLKTISEGCDKCIIEAEFDECIVRRELYANGKSRSFVDDSVVMLAELKQLSAKLIDIHSQHENLLLESDAFQLQVVDSIAQNDSIREDYRQKYEAFLAKKKQLEDLQNTAKKSKEDLDYLSFQYQQLAQANLQAGELQQLQEQEQRLQNAQEIKQAIITATHLLESEDATGAISAIQTAYNALDKVKIFLPQEENWLNRLNETIIELKDICETAEHFGDQIEDSTERLNETQERLDLLNSLLKKHQLNSDSELIELRDRLQQQLQHIESFDQDIAQLTQELTQCETALQQAANLLTDSRLSVKQTICEHLVNNLVKLGIIHAKVDISITDTDYSAEGKDNVQFMFAANLNQTLQPVRSIASGGEIARIMLCIKALIASTKGLPTIIFDEIDTGVSGEIANQMGLIMQQMAHNRQIIAITHLPQIASIGQLHYKVYKTDENERTQTHIQPLDQQGRIAEIAYMLSGNPPSPAAIENAKQLLQR